MEEPAKLRILLSLLTTWIGVFISVLLRAYLVFVRGYALAFIRLVVFVDRRLLFDEKDGTTKACRDHLCLVFLLHRSTAEFGLQLLL